MEANNLLPASTRFHTVCYTRKTLRLNETLYLLGYVLGGEAGAHLALRMGLNVSSDTFASIGSWDSLFVYVFQDKKLMLEEPNRPTGNRSV